MKVKLDDRHYLISDNYCYHITEEVEIKTGDNAGNLTERRVSGYHGNFADAVASYCEKALKASDCQTLKELSAEVAKLKKTVKGWKCAVERVK